MPFRATLLPICGPSSWTDKLRLLPRRLEGLSMLMSRETNQENPQVFIKSWPQGTQGPPTERQLSRFPHPHPTLKDLQKEVIR